MPLDSALTKYGVYKPQICTVATTPTSPYVGQTIYRTDTGEFLVYYGATTGWRPPWNQPWGFIGKTELSSNTTGITNAATELLTSSLGFTAVANRNYLVEGHVLLLVNTASSAANLILREGTTQHALSASATGLTGDIFTLHVSRVMTFSAGPHTLKLWANRGNGTGTLQTALSVTDRPDYIMVTDIGPSTSTAPTS